MKTDRRKIIRQIPNLTSSEMAVIVYIDENLGEQEVVSLSQTDFIMGTRFTLKSLRRIISSLCNKGLLSQTSKAGHSTQYSISLGGSHMTTPSQLTGGSQLTTPSVELQPRRANSPQTPPLTLNDLNLKLFSEEEGKGAVPEWATILSEHRICPNGKVFTRMIELIEDRYQHIDLKHQAALAVDWLNTNPQGKHRVSMLRYFDNWCKRASNAKNSAQRSIQDGTMTEEQRLAEVYAAEVKYG